MQSIEQEQSETGAYAWGIRLRKWLGMMNTSNEKYVDVIVTNTVLVIL